MKQIILTTALSILVTATATAQPSSPVPPVDHRWEAWLGCWQLLGETLAGERSLEPSRVATGAVPPTRQSNTGTRVCVAQTASGVTVSTLVGSQKALEETIVADGSDRPMQDEECRGTKKTEWSTRAPRLYSTAEITCADQTPRRISSVSMMTTGPTWVDIQVIAIEGRKNIRVRRYQRVHENQPGGARLGRVAGESSWTIEDIKEASAKVTSEAVQAALVEFRTGFNLKSKQLLELQRAGVADSVIDLMVALSYPDRFQIERPLASAPGPLGSGFGGVYGSGVYDSYDPLWPFYLDSMFWPSYYSPFAYRYWGMFDPYYLANSGYVVIGQPHDDDGRPVRSGEGRVVDGRGYTRVTTREAERVNSASSGVNGSTSAGTSSGGNSSGGNSGVSSGGYAGSGGDSGGRTAVPRPPGNE